MGLIPFLLVLALLCPYFARKVFISQSHPLRLLEGYYLSTPVNFNRGALLFMVGVFLPRRFSQVLIADDVVTIKDAPGLVP